MHRLVKLTGPPSECGTLVVVVGLKPNTLIETCQILSKPAQILVYDDKSYLLFYKKEFTFITCIVL